jgi:hypothetical protein
MNDPQAFNVPQRCYEFISPKDAQTRLVTRNVGPCTAFIGVKKSDSLAFMCHLDVPTSTNALQELVALIRKEHGSLDGFELYAVSMYPPWIRFLCILFFGGLAHAIAGPAIALAIFTLFAWFSSWAQFKCYWTARKDFGARIQWCLPSRFPGIFRSVGVAVDASAPEVVDVWWDEKGFDRTPWKCNPYRLKAARVRDGIGAKEFP